MNSKEFAEKLRELRKADKEAFARGTVTVAFSLPGKKVLKLEYEVWWGTTADDLFFHLPEDEQQKSDRYHHPDWLSCLECRDVMPPDLIDIGMCEDCRRHKMYEDLHEEEDLREEETL